jgi:metallo-beta-lactamase family protein
VEDSKKLNHARGPMIIISASGMCEAGRILHHLKNNIESPDNAVLLTGYQAEHTLGRRLLKKKHPIRIFGDEYRLRASVSVINELSAHADYAEMLAYFEKMGPVPQAFVVHGEMEQSQPFADRLRQGVAEAVAIPKVGQKLTPKW